MIPSKCGTRFTSNLIIPELPNSTRHLCNNPGEDDDETLMNKAFRDHITHQVANIGPAVKSTRWSDRSEPRGG